MGIAGKEVAKQAADIVLMDDNFPSIVKAVLWGRNIYDNIRRFIQFQLTVNIVAVSTAFISAVILMESPLTVVQLLWVNLIMDSFGSLALATEPPTEELLNRPPHTRKEYLISRTMWRNILSQGLFQLSVMMAIIFSAEYWCPEMPWAYLLAEASEVAEEHPGFRMFSDVCLWGPNRCVRSGRRFHYFSNHEDYKRSWAVDIGPSRHYTIVFNVFIWMQTFNLINARKINNEYNMFRGLGKNYMWITMMVVIIVGQVLMVQFGGFVLSVNLAGLTWEQWLISIGIGSLTILVHLASHLVPIRLLPQSGIREVNPLAESRSFALASRGRLSSSRLQTRLGGGLSEVFTSDRGGGRYRYFGGSGAQFPQLASSACDASQHVVYQLAAGGQNMNYSSSSSLAAAGGGEGAQLQVLL
eukprot:GHVU01207160.1.p1 GENE.GHVU01207160.1~~GHVU01207160.1.p1  ORF type:complete len:474 (-),score=89.17 GHVU01207160.1:198-1436(-)